MMDTVKIRDENYQEVDAKVGDKVAAFCSVSKRVIVGRIQSVKKEFKVDSLKITPKASRCLWLSN